MPWLWFWEFFGTTLAVVILGAAAFFGVNMPANHWLKDPDSPYPFSDKELARFHVQDRLARLSTKSV
jgi:hypothetical protein